MTFPDSLEPLLSPRAYPHPVREVKLVETHISWILLTGEIAYKIKRPVTLPFVDLHSAQHREYLCHEEVRLNKRFAPDVYLGVATINADVHGASVDGGGPVIEHAVRMRQFEHGDELDVLLNTQRINSAELGAFGRNLAGIHTKLPRELPNLEWGKPDAIGRAILRNLDETINAASGFADASPLHALRAPLRQTLAAAVPWMSERYAAGRVRECHGDLHAGNIVRNASGLVAFDCLEFEPAFRWIDVADEIAFLLADLDSHQRPQHAQAFLAGYLEQAGDFSGCRFLNVYKAHRALVRAKVMALGAAGSDDPQRVDSALERYSAYVRSAQDSLGLKRPLLILMSGLSGSGKTWLATRIAPSFGAVHIRSDVERKRLAGLDPTDRSASGLGTGLYSDRSSGQLSRHLLECAESTLAGGYTTLVDGTFGRREERRRFRELSQRVGVPVCIIHCHAPDEVLRARIQQRARYGADASEADLAVLQWQREHHEPLQAQEGLAVFEIATTDPSAAVEARRYINSCRERFDHRRCLP